MAFKVPCSFYLLTNKSSVLGFTIGARETKRNKERSVALTESLAQETTRGEKHVQQGQLN